MYKTKKVVSCFVLCVLIFSLCACGKESKDNADIYGETIGGLEDNELFVTIDTNAPLPVLLVTSQVYDEGTGKQAALDCDVYYLVDKEVKNIGSIESMGTAYPISYDETGIYTASGHAMQRFEVDKSVPLSWQTEFMSNLMKMEMLLIPWKKRMKQRLFQKKNIIIFLRNTAMLQL